jgi:hypothetical protein
VQRSEVIVGRGLWEEVIQLSSPGGSLIAWPKITRGRLQCLAGIAEPPTVRRKAVNEEEPLGPFQSRELAEFIVDALVDAGIVARPSFDRAVEIAVEEIDVRIALGNVELK